MFHTNLVSPNLAVDWLYVRVCLSMTRWVIEYHPGETPQISLGYEFLRRKDLGTSHSIEIFAMILIPQKLWKTQRRSACITYTCKVAETYLLRRFFLGEYSSQKFLP